MYVRGGVQDTGNKDVGPSQRGPRVWERGVRSMGYKRKESSMILVDYLTYISVTLPVATLASCSVPASPCRPSRLAWFLVQSVLILAWGSSLRDVAYLWVGSLCRRYTTTLGLFPMSDCASETATIYTQATRTRTSCLHLTPLAFPLFTTPLYYSCPSGSMRVPSSRKSSLRHRQ